MLKRKLCDEVSGNKENQGPTPDKKRTPNPISQLTSLSINSNEHSKTSASADDVNTLNVAVGQIAVTAKAAAAAAAAAPASTAQPHELLYKEDSENRYFGNESENTIAMNWKRRKLKYLKMCLQNIDKMGDYAVEGEDTQIPTPIAIRYILTGISLNSEPKFIEFCLQDQHHVANLLQICENDQRFHSLAGNFYEIPSKYFVITNPNLSAKVERLVLDILPKLGCFRNNFQIDLVKMIAFKPGSFKRRTADLKKRGFATLFIEVPSTSTGGQFVVYEKERNESQKVLSFGRCEDGSRGALTGVHYVAIHNDHEYEFLELTSGYRFILVYCLLGKGGGGGSVPFPCTREALSFNLSVSLKELSVEPYRIGFFLDNTYTSTALGISGMRALVGIDKDRFDLLFQINQQLSSEEQLAFYLCQFKQVSTYTRMRSDRPVDDPYAWQINTKCFEIAEWFNLDGTSVLKRYVLKPNFFTRIYQGNSQHQQELNMRNLKIVFSNDTQCETIISENQLEKRLEHVKTMLVMWPEKYTYESLLWFEFHTSLADLYESIDEGGGDGGDQHLDKKIKAIVRHLTTNEFDEKLFVDTMPLLKKANNIEYARLLLKYLNLKLNDRTLIELAKLTIHFGFEHMKDVLKKLLDASVVTIRELLGIVLVAYKTNQIEFAREVFINFILSIFRDPIEFKKLSQGLNGTNEGLILDYKESSNFQNLSLNANKILIDLAKSFILFPKLSAAAFEPLKNLMTQRFLKEHVSVLFKNFIDELIKEKEAFASFEPVRQALLSRKVWLETKLAERPPFTWRMPEASLAEHPLVEQFLRGDDECVIYSAPFFHTLQIKNFINTYRDLEGWSNRGYSIDIRERPERTVLITKTRKIYDRMVLPFSAMEEELKLIEQFFN